MEKKYLKLIVFLIGILSFQSCENIFEFSPYQAIINEKYKNTSSKNLEKINKIILNNTDTFKFTVIADSHYQYNDLGDALEDINNDSEIIFVLHAGDFTHFGMLKEYEIFHKIMGNFKIPYLTVIGNHDYLSNGEKIYQEMFGELNYSFVFNNNKFILFDNTVWESNKEPDFSWLENELSDNHSYNQIFILAHIPPFTDQFDKEKENRYKNLMANNNVKLSIHGHIHTYYYTDTYNDGVKYLVVSNSKKRSYCIITVNINSFNVEKVNY